MQLSLMNRPRDWSMRPSGMLIAWAFVGFLLAQSPTHAAAGIQRSGTLGPAQALGVDSLEILERARRAIWTYRERSFEYLSPPASIAIPLSVELRGFERRLEVDRGRAATHRPQLIATLDSLSRRLPGDNLIHGHRVGYRFLHGQVGEALAVARECLASTWWCEALTGFVLHQMGAFKEAEEAYDRMVAEMPLAMRCTWSDDLSIPLNRELADEFLAIPCLDRAGLERRLWWLSDPFYLIPGNDRRTEQFSRGVAWEMFVNLDGTAAIRNEASSRTGWPATHMARTGHGWPEWWWDLDGTSVRANLWGFSFLPEPPVLTDPTSSARADWSLHLQDRDVYGVDRRPGRTRELRQLDWGDRYLPSYTIHEDLSDQTAFFARGDSFAVAAATDLRGHPLAIRRPLDVGIVFMRDELDEPTIAWGEEVSLARYLFRTTIPAEAHLVSIEALSGQDAAARVRFGHGLPDREEGALGLSDLLLFEWQEDLPEELEAVAPHMLGSTRITGNDAVGLYWEMYGLEDAAGLEVSVTVQRQDAGFFRRLGQALRLVGERDGPSVRWEEGERDEEVAGRTLRLDLSGLEAGQYVLELEVRAQDGREAVATREFVRVGG